MLSVVYWNTSKGARRRRNKVDWSQSRADGQHAIRYGPRMLAVAAGGTGPQHVELTHAETENPCECDDKMGRTEAVDNVQISNNDRTGLQTL
jgi:hypothetical protein